MHTLRTRGAASHPEERRPRVTSRVTGLIGHSRVSVAERNDGEVIHPIVHQGARPAKGGPHLGSGISRAVAARPAHGPLRSHRHCPPGSSTTPSGAPPACGRPGYALGQGQRPALRQVHRTGTICPYPRTRGMGTVRPRLSPRTAPRWHGNHRGVRASAAPRDADTQPSCRTWGPGRRRRRGLGAVGDAQGGVRSVSPGSESGERTPDGDHELVAGSASRSGGPQASPGAGGL